MRDELETCLFSLTREPRLEAKTLTRRRKTAHLAFSFPFECAYAELIELPELMLAASNGRFLNPNRALQIYEEIEAPHSLHCNYDEWALPPGASAEMV